MIAIIKIDDENRSKAGRALLKSGIPYHFCNLKLNVISVSEENIPEITNLLMHTGIPFSTTFTEDNKIEKRFSC